MTKLLLSVFLTGCAAGHCRSQYLDSKERQIASEEHLRSAFEPPREPAEAHAFVYKPDGSKQCRSGAALQPEAMAKQLGVRVFSSRTDSDGKMHASVCGSPTGQINVFEIREADLPAALKQGFKRLREKR